MYICFIILRVRYLKIYLKIAWRYQILIGGIKYLIFRSLKQKKIKLKSSIRDSSIYVSILMYFEQNSPSNQSSPIEYFPWACSHEIWHEIGTYNTKKEKNPKSLLVYYRKKKTDKCEPDSPTEGSVQKLEVSNFF